MARSGHLRRLRIAFDRAIIASRSVPNATEGQTDYGIFTVEYWRRISKTLKYLEISEKRHLHKSQILGIAPGTLPLRANDSESRDSAQQQFVRHGRLEPNQVEVERAPNFCRDTTSS